RPADPRRGSPLRDHLPPRPAAQGVGPLEVRRPAGHRPSPPRRPPARLRLDQARPRGARRTDRRRPRHRPEPRRQDQGEPRGLNPRPLYHPPSMRRAGIIFIALLGVLAILVDFAPGLSVPDLSGSGAASRPIETKLGLDLRGGLKVEYRVNPAGGKVPTPADVEVVKQI